MTIARFLVGDVFERMAELPDGSVDLVLTSPPFLALRSYLPADHPDKAREIGSESTPAEFLQTLLELTAEWGRLLSPHGSLAVELGDTYAGSGGAGGDYDGDGLRDGQNRFNGAAVAARAHAQKERTRSPSADWPMEKSLCGIPTLYAWSLAYGRNLLTGEPSPAGQWRIRNLVAWVRPNPPVGALADKYRPATSYITIVTRARDRWFDLDAVRTQPSANSHGGGTWTTQGGANASTGELAKTIANPAGAPPLDWWEITPGGYRGAHYAVWPPELCKRLIASMCPRRVCSTCGAPSRRIVETTQLDTGRTTNGRKGGSVHAGEEGRVQQYKVRTVSSVETLGWSDCGHDTWRPGLVLDPFVGSGTTLAVCTGMARNAIGIDLDERNADLARERVGMFLDIDHPAERTPA